MPQSGRRKANHSEMHSHLPRECSLCCRPNPAVRGSTVLAKDGGSCFAQHRLFFRQESHHHRPRALSDAIFGKLAGVSLCNEGPSLLIPALEDVLAGIVGAVDGPRGALREVAFGELHGLDLARDRLGISWRRPTDCPNRCRASLTLS